SIVSSGSPIPELPIDPVNTTSTNEFYTYALGTSSTYELTSYFESDKYQQTAANSGNPDPTTYAIGSNLSITPFIHGLVGYWPLNEGSGTTAYDNSGWNNNGSLLDATTTDTGPTWTTTGCLNGGSCLSFDGTNDFIRVLNNASINPGSNNFSINVWFNANAVAGIFYNKENMYEAEAVTGYAWQPAWAWFGGGNLNTVTNQWIMMTVVYDHANQYLYRNGILVYSRPQTGDMGTDTDNLTFAARQNGTTDFFSGLISDINIYDSALTAAQVQAIYNAEKSQ
ncbi:MAG: LamG domain-containing protein, partial [Patescibacteria group bacterium]|nr:LamG domain-containing protein [Patescibacteria group bacterium]